MAGRRKAGDIPRGLMNSGKGATMFDKQPTPVVATFFFWGVSIAIIAFLFIGVIWFAEQVF